MSPVTPQNISDNKELLPMTPNGDDPLKMANDVLDLLEVELLHAVQLARAGLDIGEGHDALACMAAKIIAIGWEVAARALPGAPSRNRKVIEGILKPLVKDLPMKPRFSD